MSKPVLTDEQLQDALRPVRRKQDFHYDLGDKVKLLEIDRPGIVTGLCVDNVGIQYRVVYWNNCDRKTEWVYDQEIQPHKAT